jgi:hypothetical protein
MVGACVDVDERKRTELVLGRTQRKLEPLAAAAPIWMVLTDAAGVIEFVNRPMQCLWAQPIFEAGRRRHRLDDGGCLRAPEPRTRIAGGGES